MNIIRNFENVYLHDAEIKDLCYSYKNGEIKLNLNVYLIESKKKVPAVLIFKDVKLLYLTGTAPWGEGIYVFENNLFRKSKLLEKFKGNKNLLHYQLLLNSGDKFDIIAEDFELLMT